MTNKLVILKWRSEASPYLALFASPFYPILNEQQFAFFPRKGLIWHINREKQTKRESLGGRYIKPIWQVINRIGAYPSRI